MFQLLLLMMKRFAKVRIIFVHSGCSCFTDYCEMRQAWFAAMLDFRTRTV